jgi:hypothetical protein
MTTRDVLDGALNIAHETYNHDVLGHVTLIDRTGTNDDRLGYYLNGELYWATYDAAALNDVTHLWDKAGNRISVVDSGVQTNYSTNELNQYTGAVGAAAIYNEVNHQIGWYAGWSYSYLNDEHLKWVQDYYATKTYDLSYDALGRCVKRTLNNVTTYYVYDGEKPVLE